MMDHNPHVLAPSFIGEYYRVLGNGITEAPYNRADTRKI